MNRILLAMACVVGFALATSQAFAQAVPLLNDGTTGTTVNHLAKQVASGANGTAILPLTSDVASTTPMWVVVGGAGTTGNAFLATGGIVSCTFDAGGVTVGHTVINSNVTVGDCKDGGAPPNVNSIGIATQTVASGIGQLILNNTVGR